MSNSFFTLPPYTPWNFNLGVLSLELYLCSMIQSMTGFGKASVQLKGKTVTVEIKSLNSKGADVNVRVPAAWREKELFIRERLTTALRRGKIECTLTEDAHGDQAVTRINIPVVKSYMEQLSQITAAKPEKLLSMAVHLPEAVTAATPLSVDEEEFRRVSEALDEAIAQLDDFRTSEGKEMEKDLALRIKNISSLLQQVGEIDRERTEKVRERLQKNIAELQREIDQNRFEQELIYYLEKLDVTEEKVRLGKHLAYFREVMASGGAVGKKLGFISQEIGREVNTLGSKANHAPMQRLVVGMKDELEKIKEQLLNVL